MVVTPHGYTMDEATGVARQAAREIEAWLRKKPETVEVLNVEEDPAWRQKDVDLVYRYAKDGVTFTTTIEIKGDRWHRTGNYFLETVSNDRKQTPGCFLYSEAAYLFYYFVAERELHIIPLPPARAWFRAHLAAFRETRTTTPLANGEHYHTVGRLVPRAKLQAAVKGIKVLNLP